MDTGMGAKGTVFKGGQVLVLFKQNGKPDFVGGRVEDGETHEEALIREIWEETGLTVTIKRPISEWQFINANGRLITGITYYCTWFNGEVQLSPEHASYSWVDPLFINHTDLNRWLAPQNQTESYVRGVR